MSEAEVWIPVVEDLGSYQHDFSINLKENQNGPWLALPHHKRGSLYISLPDTRNGRLENIAPYISSRTQRWNILWLNENCLLVGSSGSSGPDRKRVEKIVIEKEPELITAIVNEEETALMRAAMERTNKSGFIPRATVEALLRENPSMP